MYDPDALADLFGAVTKQAMRDYQRQYHHPRHMDAGAFLQEAGAVLGPDGSVRIGRYSIGPGEMATKRRGR